MAKKTREVRTVFSEKAFLRLERQARLLDITPSTWIRWLAMEKVTALETASNASRMTDSVESLMSIFVQMLEEERRQKDELEEKKSILEGNISES